MSNPVVLERPGSDMLQLRRQRGNKRRLRIFLFLLPALLIYGTYNVYGIIRTFYYSTMKWTGISTNMEFIGFDNFSVLLRDSQIWHALGNNLLLVLCSVVVQLGFGLALAMIIGSKLRSTKLFRTIYFMPMLLSTVATGILWILIYDPYFGLLNEALRAMGLGSIATAWLGQERTVMQSLIAVVCWQFVPQYMILLRAGLTGIPEDVYEAATIDGASKLQQFYTITLPLLAPTLKTSAVLSLVGSLKYFDLFWVMTGGGPNGYSELMATYMYKNAFNKFNMGYASAIAVFMFVVSLVMVLLFQLSTRRKEEE